MPGEIGFLSRYTCSYSPPPSKMCKLWQITIIWQLGRVNVIIVVTVVVAVEVVSVRLGVSSFVFSTCLRREGHGTAGGVEDSLGNPLRNPNPNPFCFASSTWGGGLAPRPFEVSIPRLFWDLARIHVLGLWVSDPVPPFELGHPQIPPFLRLDLLRPVLREISTVNL